MLSRHRFPFLIASELHRHIFNQRLGLLVMIVVDRYTTLILENEPENSILST